VIYIQSVHPFFKSLFQFEWLQNVVFVKLFFVKPLPVISPTKRFGLYRRKQSLYHIFLGWVYISQDKKNI
jgi:hypothetical protein